MLSSETHKALFLLQTTWRAWTADKASRLGAALAFYAIFSIGPLFLIIVTIAGLFISDDLVQRHVTTNLSVLFSKESVDLIMKLIDGSKQKVVGNITAILGIIMLIYGAAKFFVHLQSAMNTIWEVPRVTHRKFAYLLKKYGVSLLAVFGVAGLLIASILISSIIAGIGQRIVSLLSIPEYLLFSLDLVFALLFIFVSFSLLYKYLPDTKVGWSYVWPGALLSSILFLVGKYVLSIVVGRMASQSLFGTASTFVALLVWVYYSAQVFLFGSELTFIGYKYRDND